MTGVRRALLRAPSASPDPSRGWNEMPLVKVKENESIDKAIRRFKKKCEKEGIIQDIKKSSRYLKPSERKRKKQLKAAKRRRTGKA
jgi:small subunit ribosomal protein S21